MTKLVLILALAGACSKSAPAETPKQMIAHGALVLDVRTPDEFGGGHLPTATNMPIDTLAGHLADVDKLAGGDKARPIVVYCAHGGRAARAKQALDAAGYTHVVNGGGYDDLK